MQLYTAIIFMWSFPQGALSHSILTTETLNDIFHQFLHNDTIFTPFKYIRPVPAETPLHITDKNDIRCNRAGANGQSTNVLTITAGDTVGFKPTFWIHHPGAYAAYLSAVPPGKIISNYAGDGDWFKIWDICYDLSMWHCIWASQRGGAEFYPSCAHVEVLNAGWKSTGLSPGPTARFPEAHEAEAHGSWCSIYGTLMTRKMPGPQVWDGR
ncbi:hypothetical protein QC761_300190 [Podospora bellae-mahoneyi]|uniref:lytic cellulose monooxygenase (C4-dehydrogenating) n=1 Tax=Podospora bellae-mahoneyi TaxID=2093777 RepID=A0ABR0FKE5_9PEZI|nr:hypothetical protein QC761_300190 [Podospora bellae-mahoneyi]